MPYKMRGHRLVLEQHVIRADELFFQSCEAFGGVRLPTGRTNWDMLSFKNEKADAANPSLVDV